MIRDSNFLNGPEQPELPEASVPSGESDLIPLSSLRKITGTRASPSAIVAGTGVEFTGVAWFNVWFVQGSGGAVDISANPQIAAGTNVGQRLVLHGRSDTNTVKLEHSTGVNLKNKGEVFLFADDTIEFHWDGTNWTEI